MQQTNKNWIDPIQRVCNRTIEQVNNIAADKYIMSLILTLLSIFLLKGFGLQKKELLRATILLFLINALAFTMCLNSNSLKDKLHQQYDYFTQTAHLQPLINTKLPIYGSQARPLDKHMSLASQRDLGKISLSPTNTQNIQEGQRLNPLNNLDIKAQEKYIVSQVQTYNLPFQFEEGKTVVI